MNPNTFVNVHDYDEDDGLKSQVQKPEATPIFLE